MTEEFIGTLLWINILEQEVVLRLEPKGAIGQAGKIKIDAKDNPQFVYHIVTKLLGYTHKEYEDLSIPNKIGPERLAMHKIRISLD
jgi:hypothetical protein